MRWSSSSVRVSTFDCNPRSSSIDGGPPHPQSSVACPSLSHGTDVEAVRTLPATCCLLRTFLRLLSWGRPRSSGVAVVFVHKVSKVRCFTRKKWGLTSCMVRKSIERTIWDSFWERPGSSPVEVVLVHKVGKVRWFTRKLQEMGTYIVYGRKINQEDDFGFRAL
jgi:hypothetical protein